MSTSQTHPGAALLRPHLRDCGYRPPQLVTNIEMGNGRRYTVPLAAFARSPRDSRSACIAVIDAGGSDPEAAVASCRSLGAPLVFLYFPDQLQLWGQSTVRPKLLRRITHDKLPDLFREQKTEFAPESVYRAKTLGRLDKNYQLEFVDVGLMPLVEEEAGRKLAELIERVVEGTKSRLKWRETPQQQGHWLLKSNFWLLAAKILKDKNVPAFTTLDFENLPDVFARISKHYDADALVEVGSKSQTAAL